MFLLTGCFGGNHDIITPDALNNIACPDIKMAYKEKEFEIKNNYDNIFISSAMSVADAKCIADKDHIRLTVNMIIKSVLKGDIENDDILALPLSYHMTSLIPHDNSYPVQKKIFFTSQDFTNGKKENHLNEIRTIKISKSDKNDKKAIIKIGFSK